MRRVARILVVSMAWSAGCATSRYAGPTLTPAVEQTIREAHPRAALEVIVPGPRGGRRGELLRVLPTNALVSVPEGQTSVPLGSIDEIAVTNHPRGALAGAGIGVVAGAATAAGLVFATTSPCSSSSNIGDGCNTRGMALLGGGIVLGMFGAAVGMVLGSARAPTTTYHFGASDGPSHDR
jgi:hypothetical protein